MDECFVFEETRDGDLLFRQPQLARTLERMAEKGPEWFYSGPIGSAAHSVWRRAGVGISLEDWPDAPQNVDVVAAPALLVDGVRIQAAPLGLSGSACLFAVATAAAKNCLASDDRRSRRTSRGHCRRMATSLLDAQR